MPVDSCVGPILPYRSSKGLRLPFPMFVCKSFLRFSVRLCSIVPVAGRVSVSWQT